MEPISIIIFIVVAITILLYSIAIYDLITRRSKFKQRSTQSLWLIFVVFIPVVGSVIYLSLRKTIR
jgi:uncharacterized membrane protein YhaH (DUF805 family)